MAGTRQAALIAGLLCGWLAGAAAAGAQTIPLPVPAPLAKEGAAGSGPRPPATVQSTPAPAAQQAPAPAATNPLSALIDRLTGNSSGSESASAFDPTQRALCNKVSTYLSGIQALSGNFVQIGPDGRRAGGHLYLQKPGKVRFEYDPPSPIDVVADGQSVVVRNRQLATQDVWPLSQTPLRYLLADRIDLLRDTNVVGVSADDTFVTIVVEESQALIGTSRLSMMFDAKNFRLKQWTITDPQGLDTTIAVSNLDTSKRPDPDLFKIDYTRYVQ
jgi:outer membrane lipoprotein-sorting protein